MAEVLTKLRPDRDLQCYFERPSANAALSACSATGFTVSGSWRQQFDWAVVEWNRDNVFEHPLFRHLPDGDLSTLTLSYEETRENCIELDSTLFPTVDWPYLRIWADPEGVDRLYKIPLMNHASPVEGSYTAAACTFMLSGTPTPGDYVEIAWLDEHYTHLVSPADSITDVVDAIVNSVNALSPLMSASRAGAGIILMLRDPSSGANGNRIGVYGNVAGACTETWEPRWQHLSGGASPTRWRIELAFDSLRDETGSPIPVHCVRKMRWTYAAALQPGAFLRSEFQVVVSNWEVGGSNVLQQVAGPGSRRVEDDRDELVYSGDWTEQRGNYSGGSIRCTTGPASSVSLTYSHPSEHYLYIGTRRTPDAAPVSIVVDEGQATIRDLSLPGEDVLIRLPVGQLSGGVSHCVTLTHMGPAEAPSRPLFFDFFELTVPSFELPVIDPDGTVTLATDWDTDHSIALAPERTAWMIHSLGFSGRANHYVGALWFYEMVRCSHQYATGSIEFAGTPDWLLTPLTEVQVGMGSTPTVYRHVTLAGDTTESIAKAFEFMINSGSTAIWAAAEGCTLTIQARQMGTVGNSISVGATPMSGMYRVEVSSSNLSGGCDGEPEPAYQQSWRTDLKAVPRLNRACRDWTRSFFAALDRYGIQPTAAFSTELQHGDPGPDAGVAQRYPSGNAVIVNTPAVQTNFSLVSLAFWKEAFRDMAKLMEEAGVQPYLQFGETQWWYFPDDGSGMPFYDDFTASNFAVAHGRPLHLFVSPEEDPAAYPEECAYLSGLIGDFTMAIQNYVKQAHPLTRFEVLYPPDVNDTALMRVMNYPAAAWAPAEIDSLKTENFSYTFARNLDEARESIAMPIQNGFPRASSSHLVGIGDYTTPWLKEVGACKGEGVESVVLWALDQYCLIGYPTPLERQDRHSGFLG